MGRHGGGVAILINKTKSHEADNLILWDKRNKKVKPPSLYFYAMMKNKRWFFYII